MALLSAKQIMEDKKISSAPPTHKEMYGKMVPKKQWIRPRVLPRPNERINVLPRPLGASKRLREQMQADIEHRNGVDKLQAIGNAGRRMSEIERGNLYSRTDKGLAPKEIIKKYEYLTNDNNMGYEEKKQMIDQARNSLGQINAQSSRIGRYLKPTAVPVTPEEIRKASELSTRLAQQTKGTAFAAGLLNGAGFGLLANPVKVSPSPYGTGLSGIAADEKRKKQAMIQNKMAESMGKQVQGIKAAHPGYFGGGNLVGDLAKTGLLYGTVGGAAEKAVKGAPLVGKAIGGLKSPMAKRAATFGVGLLGQQAADTVVNTPLTAMEALREGKDGKGVALDILKQQGADLAFNAVLGGGSEALKHFKGKKMNIDKKKGNILHKEMNLIPKETALSQKAESINGEDIDKLKAEYTMLNDTNFWKDKLNELTAKYGKNNAVPIMQELDKFEARYNELKGIFEKTAKGERTQAMNVNKTVKDLSNLFSVHGRYEKTAMKEVAERMGKEILEKGSISKEAKEELFQMAYEAGKISNKTEVAQYEGLKNFLKRSKFSISITDSTSIPDFDAFRKSTFRKLGGITTRGNGVPVDVKYKELASIFPEFFPKHITHPADQLVQIATVAEDLSIKEQSLTALYGAEAPKGFREDFDRYIDQLAEKTKLVGRYNADKAVKNTEIAKEYTTKEMTDIFEQKYKMEKQSARVVDRNLLTEKDNVQIDRLLKGEISFEELPKDVNVKGIREVYEAKKPLYEINNVINKYRESRRTKLHEGVAKVIESSDLWKDKKAGLLYSRETMERNFRDIIPDQKEAEKVIDYFFTPVHENTAKATKLKNYYREQIKALHISQKDNIPIQIGGQNIKVSESFLVQYLGEGEFQLRKLMGKKQLEDSEVMLYRELKANIGSIRSTLSPEVFEKVERSIQVFQEIYKEIHPKINEVLVRNGYEPIGYIEGYIPHFLEDKADNFLGRIARKLGFKIDTSELPTNIAGITQTFRPGKQWSGNLLHREGNRTVFDAVKGFDQYIENIGNIIHHTDDIQKLRTLETELRLKYSSEGIKKEFRELMRNKNLAREEKESLIDDLFKRDITQFPNLVTEIRTYTDLLAGKKHSGDRGWEQELGRGVYNISKSMENRIAANMVALNLGSWLTNVIPFIQAAGEVPIRSLLNGLKDTLKNYKAADGLIEKSAFLTNIKGSKLLSMTALESLTGMMASPMEFINETMAGTLVRGKYYDNVKKGMDEISAMKDADKFAAAVIADRSKGALPTLFEKKNPLIKVFTMFQLEQNNQLSYLFKDLPRNKQGDARKILNARLKMFFGAYLYNELYEWGTGRRCALDPFSVANDALSDLTGYRVQNVIDWGTEAIHGEFSPLEQAEKKGITKTTLGIGKNIAQDTPFFGGLIGGGRLPISAAFPNGQRTWNSGVGLLTGEMNKKKAIYNLGKELAKPALYLGMPMGGGQIKKAVEGLGTMKRGGSYSIDKDGREQLEFAVNDRSPLRYVQAAAFGKYAIPEAKGYVESGFKKLSANDTEKYKKAISETGIEPKEYLTVLNDIRNVDYGAKRAILKRTNLTEKQKEFFYRNIIAEDVNQEKLDMKMQKIKNGKIDMNTFLEVENKVVYFDRIYKNKVVGEYDVSKSIQKANEVSEYLNGLQVEEPQRAVLKELYLSKKATELKEKYQKIKNVLPPNEFERINKNIELILSDKNGNGESIPYSRARKRKRYLDGSIQYKNDSERYQVYEAFEVSEKLW